jgi:uncharacterized SAM-dependent methyltransferase
MNRTKVNNFDARTVEDFGTRLEQRFAKQEIQKVMESSGLENIKFIEDTPFWTAVGFAKVDG